MAHFGSIKECGGDVPNRLDVSGAEFLMRFYRPGQLRRAIAPAGMMQASERMSRIMPGWRTLEGVLAQCAPTELEIEYCICS